MKSRTTKRFREAFLKLPSHVRKISERTYLKWKTHPELPSLQFKKIHNKKPIYSVRVSLGYRALGLKEGNSVIWFWIGSHSDYDKLISEIT